ncbi:hypothetical protein BCR33DRAFT_786231 [Rhizoclosmatium globosum]|uniref:DDE-1 domain-containing protein n=1 Tax=Rhizoclosmatium globosum TaxID=329046 RepID=A0A1Y2C623_9FUNG|nr:hypothetical protein BCR33DRAFT_786231 [Rhizoclosmatium globosum]|eukprot:ORY42490.1 hypothetical protein BCR33DRAFT_786231 [Rhizoclosmatium globosum]
MLSKWVRSFETIKDESVRQGGKYMHCGWGSVMVDSGRKEHSRINRAPPSLSHSSVDFDGIPSILSSSPSMVRCMFLEEEVKLSGLVADQSNRGFAVSLSDLSVWMLAHVKDPLQVLANAALDVGMGQQRIAAFDDFIYRQQTNGLTVKDVYNFDQTRLYFDMSLKKTVHWKGSTNVIIKNTGNESTGFSVGLMCLGDGHRLPPLVVFKGARTGRLAKTVPVQFDGDLILNECIPQLKSDASGRKNAGIIPAVIPGGYTSKLTSTTRYWNHQTFQGWNSAKVDSLDGNSITDASELNADGRRKRPSHAIICSWISSAWNDVDNSVFEAAFRKGLWARRAI